MSGLSNLFLLTLAGFIGAVIFDYINVPAGVMLGALFAVSILKIAGCPLQASPNFFNEIVLVMLGYHMGANLTKSVIKQYKFLLVPIIMVIMWSIIIVIVLGYFLYLTTDLDLYTSMLSSSAGGLPEVSAIAIETGADITIVVIVQTFRLILTVFVFPFMIKKAEEREVISNINKKDKNPFLKEISNKARYFNINSMKQHINIKYICSNQFKKDLLIFIVTLSFALIAGNIFNKLKITAGTLIGSLLVVAGFSISGVQIKQIPNGVYNLMLILTGITVADNISIDSVKLIMQGDIIFPIIIVAVVTIITSFVIAYLIHKISGLDLSTCFLASAPGGFATMVLLAIEYDLDYMPVSIIHVFRLTAISLLIPILFSYFPNML